MLASSRLLEPGTPVRVIGSTFFAESMRLETLAQRGDEGVIACYAGWAGPQQRVERSRLGEGWVGPDGPFYAAPAEAYDLPRAWGYPPHLAVHFYLVRLQRLEQLQPVWSLDMNVPKR